MKTKAICILAVAAICILITPAFSQGGEGRNGNQGTNMGPTPNNAMMSGPNFAPFGQGSDINQDQAPNVPRFNGCNTRCQKMSSNDPICKPPSNAPNGLENGFGPQRVQDGKLTPWQHLEQDDEQHDGPFFGFSDKGKHAPSRSIMAHDYHKEHPKKSLMEKKHEKKHKKTLRHLRHDDFPEMPPMRSIMGHGI